MVFVIIDSPSDGESTAEKRKITQEDHHDISDTFAISPMSVQNSTTTIVRFGVDILSKQVMLFFYHAVIRSTAAQEDHHLLSIVPDRQH